VAALAGVRIGRPHARRAHAVGNIPLGYVQQVSDPSELAFVKQERRDARRGRRLAGQASDPGGTGLVISATTAATPVPEQTDELAPPHSITSPRPAGHN
jgi:hypothetical protein